MKLSQSQLLQSGLTRRWTAQVIGVAVFPLAGIAGWLWTRSILTTGTLAGIGVAAVLAVLAAAFVGLGHARWVLQRFSALAMATAELAREKFPVQLASPGSDEFARLAGAFNALTRHMALRHAVQRVLDQMDESLFTKTDVRILVRGVLRCLAMVSRADVAILALREPDSDDTLALHMLGKGERSRVETLRVELDAAQRGVLPAAGAIANTAATPFPDEVTERLRKEFGAAHFFIMPVARGSRVWGFLIAGHSAPARISTERIKLLSSACNRLIAGFRNTERDRTIHSLAFVDRLTGLPNRTALESVLAQRLAAARQERTLLAVLLVDLDRFKQVNDTYGHALGDHLLVEARRRIQIHLIEDDVAARVGGDAFALVLSHVSTPRDTALVARKLIRSLSRAFTIGGHTVYTGASVGIALFRGDRDPDLDLLKKAESAMYRAKAAGRNRLAFYEPEMNAQSRRRSQLDADLRAALKRNEFVLHYQPQIDLKTGALAAVEALLRWQHPTLGLLPPGNFIGDAEEIGLIPEIGAWVMREACLQHKRWRTLGLNVPRVSVNVSNGQLPRSNFVSTVREIIAATGIPPGVLEIEVTETMLVEGGNAAMDALEQLSADGIAIAIDDFGTGYSSFSYLKVMPARVLKLDMSFIVDLNPSNNTGKIVAAIINMAHALQKEVVAEGIERPDQLQLLKDLGCDRGQGYLLGRPVNPDAIVQNYSAQRDYTRPPAGLASGAQWTLPPVPASTPAAPPAPAVSRLERPARAATPDAASTTVAKAQKPAVSPDDYWNNDLLEEALTVPRFLEEDFISPS
jgi:diguanylate cyclase (GGDEF)-like protein